MAKTHAKQKVKLTAEQVREIRSASGSLREIGTRFGVTHKTIEDIKKGRIWKQTSYEHIRPC